VLLLGDSITLELVSRPDGDDRVCSEGACYSEKLKTLLGKDYSVTNAGIGGLRRRTGCVVPSRFRTSRWRERRWGSSKESRFRCCPRIWLWLC